MWGITRKCLHHSVTHSLPRAEYPGGCWGPLARMNYEAGHSRPGRSSHSQTGPQACLYPPAKGSHHLTVIPTPAAFPTVTLPSFQNTHLCCSQPWSPIQRLSKGLICLDGPLFHSTFDPLETSLKKQSQVMFADHSNDLKDKPQRHLPLKFNSFWFIKY